jgi:hypothetical protein
LLALNCGFGQAEVATLQLAELRLGHRHPKYAVVGDWIMRLRYKSRVYGEWSLWPETAAAVRWLRGRRPADTTATELVLSQAGRPLLETSGSNRSSKLGNSWAALHRRIAKDHGAFRRLSFNKLRKTAADLVRQLADGETAGVFLCHGQAVAADGLLDRYSNRDFRRVFAANDQVRQRLAPMFAAVPDPFPADYRKSNPALSLGTIKRIRELRRQGYKIKAIAEQLEVAPHTVMRWLQAEKDS